MGDDARLTALLFLALAAAVGFVLVLLGFLVIKWPTGRGPPAAMG